MQTILTLPGIHTVTTTLAVSGPRQILLVSYHFGPGCATGGFRWNALVEGLAAKGWNFDVVTVTRPEADWDSWLPRFPAGSVRVAQVDPVTWPDELMRALTSGSGRIRRRIPHAGGGGVARPPFSDGDSLPPGYSSSTQPTAPRGPVAMASEVVFGCKHLLEIRQWARRAGHRAAEFLEGGGYRGVVVSSPPHESQRVGVRLARRFGVPYLADLRDPWIDGIEPLDAWVDVVTRWAGYRLERKVLATADVLIHNAPRALRELSRIQPTPRGSRVVIPNGYDSTPGGCGRPDPELFRVVYTGWIHPYMNVMVLLRACRRFLHRHSVDASRFRLDLMGVPESVNGVPITTVLSTLGLGEVSRVHPPASRAEAAALQARGSILAAFDYPHGLAVVMKFYDYLPMSGRMLLLGNPEGALSEAAGRVGVEVIGLEDLEKQDALLDEAYMAWIGGTFPPSNDPGGVFARQHSIERMDSVLSSIGQGVTPLSGGSTAGLGRRRRHYRPGLRPGS